MRFKVEQVNVVKYNRPVGNFITGAARQHIAERRFTRPVRPHNRMNLARIDGERQTFEDRLIRNRGVEIFNFQHFYQLF